MKNRSRPAVRSDVGPFAIVPMWLLEAGVGGNAIRVYAALAGWYADRNDGKAHPSRSTLAKRLGISTDTVDRAVRELDEAGAIEVEARFAEEGDRSTNVYTVVFARPGSRSDAATGSRTDAATGSRTDAAGTRTKRNENQGNEKDLPAAPEFDPVKGRRVDGRDLPWDALAEETLAYGEANGARMKRALTSIRKEIVEEAGPEAVAAFLAAYGPDGWERAVAAEIRRRAAALRDRAPTLTWGPEGIAKNWAVAGSQSRSVAEILRSAS